MEVHPNSSTRSIDIILSTGDIDALLDGDIVEDSSTKFKVVAELLPETAQDPNQFEPDTADEHLRRELGVTTSRALVSFDRADHRERIQVQVAESLLRSANVIQSESLYGSDIQTELDYTPVSTIRIELDGNDSIENTVA